MELEKAELIKLQAAADAATKAAAYQQASEATLAALEKQMSDIQQQADALKQKLGK
jgi:hypothetical protein